MASEEIITHPAFPPSPTPQITYGPKFPILLTHHLKTTFHASKIYIIVSNSISKTPVFTNLEKYLREEGIQIVGVRRGIRQHSPLEDLLEVILDVRGKGEGEVEVLVTLGAGSLTDGVKVVGLGLANNIQTLPDLKNLSIDKNHMDLKPSQIPIINIPTSLSGGEYSPGAGATDLSNYQKVGFYHPSLGAQLIILDPELTISTPAKIWLSTGIRGVDHCVEGLCSMDTKIEGREKIDEGFEKGLRELVGGLVETKRDWEGRKGRLECMFGVLDAMAGLRRGVQMGGSHGIGHQLGPLGVGHGETSCILLPAVLRYNFTYGDEVVKGRQRKVVDVFWGVASMREVLERRGLVEGEAGAGGVVEALVLELGMPRTLGEVGVGRDALDGLADNCLKDRWLKTNAVPLLEKKQVLEILEKVVGDEKSNL